MDRTERRRTISRGKLSLALVAALAIAGAAGWALLLPGAEDGSPREGGGIDLMSMIAADADADFAGPSPDWALSLPQDHGPHQSSRTESWNVAAHLGTESGERLGFQFSLVRFGLVPPDAPQPTSVWSVRKFDRGHAIFFDGAPGQATGEERFGRGVPGISGYDPDTGELRHDNWTMRFGRDETGERIELRATVQDDAVLKLVMRPEKRVLSMAPDGADLPFVGYSMTRLAVEGTVDRGRGEEAVTGTAWFDHLWGELPLPGAGPVAWDRLQLHLGDGTDISVIRSRRVDGRGAAAVNAVLVAPDGATTALDEASLQVTGSRTWQDPTTDAAYPVEWRLVGPDFEMTVTPLADAQVYDFQAPLWSGIVQVRGQRGGKAISGTGTMQLTGYGAP